jgi:hypothetical protein
MQRIAAQLRLEKYQETEKNISNAIDAIRMSGTNPDGSSKFSVRAAASQYGIPRSTLQGRLNGSQSRKDAHIQEQKLTPAQESLLTEWIKVKGKRGIGMTYKLINESASDICGTRVGESYAERFVNRHRNELKTKMTTSLESCRAQALNRAVVKEFYDILSELRSEFNLKPQNEYNMDEKGVQLGIGGRYTAIIDRDQATVYSIEQGTRDLITVIECVCADGSAIHPVVIFEGKRMNYAWTEQNPCNASYVFYFVN